MVMLPASTKFTTPRQTWHSQQHVPRSVQALPAVHRCHQRDLALHNPPSSSSSSRVAAAQAFPLEGACLCSKAAIGLNSQGYRGLLAAADIAPGDVVLSIPLYNMLQVPRQLSTPDMQAAAAAALARWQQQHWQLPAQLAAFLARPEVIWESKLVAWLLYLKAAAPEGSLWRSYIQSLPAAADAITFCSYSEQQAEQLQFSVWKTLAHKQRQLLHTVQQQCKDAGLQKLLSGPPPGSSGGSDGSSSSSSDQADYAWALSMVKSRTFGQKLPPPAAAATAAATTPLPAAPQSAPAAAAAQELQQEDDSGLFLLMAPYIDMINHAPDNNCVFGIDPGGNSFSVRCSSSSSNNSSSSSGGSSSSSSNNSSSSGSSSNNSRSSGGIQQGAEVTISYGSNKSNLALLSCYGFQIPGNPNDQQLLAPIFSSCLAAAGGLKGLPTQLLQDAAAAVAAASREQQAQGQPSGVVGMLLQPGVVAARRQCALASLPADCSPQQQQPGVQSGGASNSEQPRHLLLQQQQYLAQLMVYQVGLISKRCGSSIEADMEQMSLLTQSGVNNGGDSSSSSSSSDGLAVAIQQQALLARLEHKLVLRECESILKGVLGLIQAELAAAVA